MTHATILGWPYSTLQMPRWPFSRNRSHWQSEGLEYWFSGAAPIAPDIVPDLAGASHGTATGITQRATHWGTAAEWTPASSSVIDLPSREYINSSAPFTITWTMYQDALTDAFPALCSLETDGVAWLCLFSANASYADVQIGAPSTWVRLQATYPSGSSVTGGWNWGCVTYNGGGSTDSANYDCFIDGTEAAWTGGGGLGAFSGSKIGNLSVAGSRFDGAIADFRIYNRAFTAKQAYWLWHPSQRWALYQGARSQTVAPWVGPGAAAAADVIYQNTTDAISHQQQSVTAARLGGVLIE